jgi:hypothetical protein
MQFSSEQFDSFFRGVIRRANLYRFTLKKFDNGEEAELYALALMMRFRSIWQ